MKMEYLRSLFNATFGSNITHLANASGGQVTAYIQCEQINITRIDVNNEKVNVVFERAANRSMFLLGDRKYHRYERLQCLEYLTVVDSIGNKICENYQMYANKSFIILADGITICFIFI
jgi:hypothetical protein